jgi:hypothetical protein
MHRYYHELFPHRLMRAALAIMLVAGLIGCAANRARFTPLPGNGVTVYAAGDIADCRQLRKASDSGAADTAQLIAAGMANDPEASVLTLGDNAYQSGVPAEFNHCYGPTWGRFKARTHPSPGNHEYYSKGAAGYYDYFGPAAGPEGRGYYSFRLGNWHVIALNSMLRDAQFQAQLDWLKQDLEQNKALCTLAYWHHPVYSSGGHSDNPLMLPVWKALAAAGADLVLNGHDHHYERFAPLNGEGQRDDANGMREMVVGTGGAQLTPLLLPRANSEVRDNSVHGVLKLVLKENGYEWEFLPAKDGGFTDRGSGLCH